MSRQIKVSDATRLTTSKVAVSVEKRKEDGWAQRRSQHTVGWLKSWTTSREQHEGSHSGSCCPLSVVFEFCCLKKIWSSGCILENYIRTSGTQTLMLFFNSSDDSTVWQRFHPTAVIEADLNVKAWPWRKAHGFDSIPQEVEISLYDRSSSFKTY